MAATGHGSSHNSMMIAVMTAVMAEAKAAKAVPCAVLHNLCVSCMVVSKFNRNQLLGVQVHDIVWTSKNILDVQTSLDVRKRVCSSN